MHTRTSGGHWAFTVSQGVTIGTLGWIVVGVAAWLAVAGVVGVLIGRTVRQRDRQVPREWPTHPVLGIPAQAVMPDLAEPAPRVAAWGRVRRT